MLSVLSFSILSFSVFLWLTHHVISMHRVPALLRGRYQLFRQRDKLRRLYISVQCKEIEDIEFRDEDFTAMESRINNAINVLPLVSARFVYLYMEGKEMQEHIERKESIRRGILKRYATTPIGKPLEEIDEQMSCVLYSAYCWNFPIYGIYHYVADYWRWLCCQVTYKDLPKQMIPHLQLQQLLSIDIPIGDLVSTRSPVLVNNSIHLLAKWSRMPES